MRKSRGKPSEETIRKISEAHKNLSEEKRQRILYGIRHNRYSPDYGKKLSDSQRGEKNSMARLKEKQVIEIKKLWKTGMYSTENLGEMFGVSRQSISDIVYGRTWKHVQIDE